MGPYIGESQVDPTGPTTFLPTRPAEHVYDFTGPFRVMRGGDFAFARYLRSVLRYPLWPSEGGVGVGVGARLLRTGPKITTAAAPETWGQIKDAH